jgi:single-strand DNA-binding protein
MTEPSVSFAGNLTNDPEVRYTEGGIARAMFRVAVSGRREQKASFYTVIVLRDQAEHAAQSLSRGSRVVGMGRLQQRSWTAEDGSTRSTVEVVATSWGRACGGRRRRLGRRATRSGSQLDRCGGAGCKAWRSAGDVAESGTWWTCTFLLTTGQATRSGQLLGVNLAAQDQALRADGRVIGMLSSRIAGAGGKSTDLVAGRIGARPGQGVTPHTIDVRQTTTRGPQEGHEVDGPRRERYGPVVVG